MIATTLQARKHATRLARALDQDLLLSAELADAHGRLLATARRLVPAVDRTGLLDMEIQAAHAERVAESRRRLALKIGGLYARLADELHSAGWSDTQDRHANAHELANRAYTTLHGPPGAISGDPTQADGGRPASRSSGLQRLRAG